MAWLPKARETINDGNFQKRTNEPRYLMGPFNAGPKSALFLVVVLIKAGVRGPGVIRPILKREYHVFEKLSFSKFGILHP